MKELELKIQILDPNLYDPTPKYAHLGDAGFDLRARIEERQVIPPHQRAVFPTGLKMEIPLGYELQIRPRSGMAAKHGITVLNTPGTIDAGFRDEVGVILINTSDEPYYVEPKERIAQGVLKEFVTARFVVVPEVDKTINRNGGIGHSGRF